MRIIIAKIVLFFSKLIGLDLSKSSKSHLRVIPWIAANGDATFRLDYNLVSTSIVFDLGGYKGDFVFEVYNKYKCQIHVFEPYLEYSTNISNRFKGNSQIFSNAFGLANKDSEEILFISDEGSSTINKLSENGVKIKLIQFEKYLLEHNIEKISLLKINIEGGEYDLLEYLIGSGLIKKIDNLQIQFHDFVLNSDIRMQEIQSKLSLTHSPTFKFRYVWENWKIN